VFNVPGDDNDRLASETVAIVNVGSGSLNLRGWSLRDAFGHRYVFDDCTLTPNQRAFIHTGEGQDVLTGQNVHLYQGRRRAIWNNTGDTALMIDPDQVVRAAYTYLEEEGY
jgi:hypothetical protein